MSRIVDVEQLGCLIWKDGEHGTTFDDGVLWVLEKIGELPTVQICEDAVSRQAAIDCATYDVEYTIECIKKLPSVQPQHKTGKWEEHIFDGPMGRRPKALMCSCCNAICLFAYDYCPKCGADMRGEKNESD